jgi:hypothetical protein
MIDLIDLMSNEHPLFPGLNDNNKKRMIQRGDYTHNFPIGARNGALEVIERYTWAIDWALSVIS